MAGRFHGTRRALYKAPAVSAAAPYVGPGDLVSGATGWWGLRAYSAATAGTPAVRLIRSSDSSQADISTLTNGSLNVAAAFFNGSVSYKVVTLYDQSGNGLDATQGTDAARPAFILSGLGSLPVMRVAGAQFLATGGSADLAQPHWISAVANRTGAFTSKGSYFGESSGSSLIGYDDAVDSLQAYAGTVFNTPGTDNAWHAIQTVLNNASSEIYVDGSNNTGTTNIGHVLEPIKLFTDNFNLLMTGDCGEIGYWNNVAPNSTQKSNINSNQHTYWGF